MIPEESNTKYEAAEVSHFAVGTAETVGEFGKGMAEALEGGDKSSTLTSKAADVSVAAMRNAGISSNTIKSVGVGSAGSLQIVGGVYAAYKGFSSLRNASGIELSPESVENAVKSSGISLDEVQMEALQKNFKQSFREQGITSIGNFVNTSFRNSDSKDIENKFQTAIKSGLSKMGIVGEALDIAANSILAPISKDLGFDREDGQLKSLTNFNDRSKVVTKAIQPKDLQVFTQGNPAKLFEALEASGVIENGQVRKAPDNVDMSAIFKMAGVDQKGMALAQSFLSSKANGVAEVPTWTNAVNSKEKAESAMVGTMGLASITAGALVLVAGFAGVAALAAASFGIAVTGLAVTTSIVARDIYKDSKASKSNSQLANAHKELANTVGKSNDGLSKEHELKAEMFENKAKQSQTQTLGGSMFMASLLLTAASMVLAATGVGAVAGLAIAAVASFGVGVGATIYAKSNYGAKVDNLSAQIQQQQTGVGKDQMLNPIDLLQNLSQDPKMQEVANNTINFLKDPKNVERATEVAQSMIKGFQDGKDINSILKEGEEKWDSLNKESGLGSDGKESTDVDLNQSKSNVSQGQESGLGSDGKEITDVDPNQSKSNVSQGQESGLGSDGKESTDVDPNQSKSNVSQGQESGLGSDGDKDVEKILDQKKNEIIDPSAGIDRMDTTNSLFANHSSNKGTEFDPLAAQNINEVENVEVNNGNNIAPTTAMSEPREEGKGVQR
ncbi:MAG: hypothetical protein ISQ32_02485 [Rickettsiales bacterium]|nr:hypothetical protein [Rickettsiales bacterium]